MSTNSSSLRRDRREREWQFTLRDVLWLTAGVAVVLAVARLVSRTPTLESSSVLAIVFWPAPLAMVGLVPQSRSAAPPAEVTPKLSSYTLWKTMGVGYAIMLVELGVSTATGVADSSFGPLAAGVLAGAHVAIVTLGGLIVAESFKARDRFPTAHIIGLALYLYWLVAGGIFSLWFALYSSS